MPKIYTKTGDSGQTGLWGGARVPKDHPRVRAYGDVDELNAALGLARAALAGHPRHAASFAELGRVQAELFELGAELAADPSKPGKARARVGAAHVRALEKAIDRMEEALPPLRSFILPGGREGGSALHLARAVCRRAERSAVSLSGSSAVSPDAFRYLNRLSDYLFVLARFVNAADGAPDVPWVPGRPAG